MYEFLLTATDPHGKRKARRVRAKTAAEAYEKLESRGFTDITLHTDDVMAATTPRTPDNGFVSLDDTVKLRDLSRVGFFFFLLKSLVKVESPFLAVSAAVLGYQLGYVEEPNLKWALISGGVLLSPIGMALWMVLFGSAQKYNALVHAYSWGQWDKVIELAPPLRGKVPEFDLEARVACALAARGDFDEGLRKMQKFENDKDTPRWMYLGRLGEFYKLVDMHDEALECMREAYDEAPENPTVILDYAMTLLANEQNSDLARKLIAAAEEQRLNDILAMILPSVKASYALNTGDYHSAMELFEEADKSLKKIEAASPLVGALIDSNRAYWAIAQAKTGDVTQARKTAARAIKRFRATNSRQLVERLERELMLEKSAA